MTLGAAQFILTGDNAQLLGTLAQSEEQTRRSVKSMADQYGVSAAAVTAASRKIAAEEAKKAAAIQAADAQIIAATKAMLAAKKQEEESFKSGALALIGFATIGGLAFQAVNKLQEGFGALAEATARSQQSQFQLNKLYGDAAPVMEEFARQQAAIGGASKTDLREAISQVATLGRNYALTSEQQKTVIKISQDLAAVTGITVAQATERVQSALRGEGEAVEYLGQTLNLNAVKAFGNMTEAQRKNFETLSDVTKAQLILGKLTEDTANVTGAAAERAQTAIGKWEGMRAALVDLEAEIGQHGLPLLASFADAFTPLIAKTNESIETLGKFNEAGAALRKSQGDTSGVNADILLRPGGALEAVAVEVGKNFGTLAATSANAWFQHTFRGIDVPSSVPGSGAGDAALAAQAAADQKAQQKQAEAAEKDRQRIIADVRTRARKAEAEASIAAIQEEQQRQDAAFEASKRAYEADRDARIKAVDAAKTAALENIDTERRAAQAASEAQIARLETQQQAAERAAEDTHKAALEAIEAERLAVHKASESQIKDIEARRDRAKDASDETRDNAIANLDAEKRAREDQRIAEDRALDDSVTAQKRALEDSHRARLRAIDDEVAAIRKRGEEEKRSIDDQGRSAEASHQKRIRQIEARKKAQEDAKASALAAIAEQEKADERAHDAVMAQIAARQDADSKRHDERLRALDDELAAEQYAHDEIANRIDEEGRAESERHRAVLANLDAEQKAREAAIDAQLGALDAADREAQRQQEAQRLQDSLASAQSGLKKAESTGNLSEIEAAQRAVAAAQKAIQDATLASQRDAAREQLQIQRKSAEDEIATRRAAEDESNRLIDERLAAEKRAADDALAVRKQQLAGEKQAEDDAFKAVKDRYDAEGKVADDALTAAKNRHDAERAQIEQTSKKTADRYDKEKQQADDALARTKQRLSDRKQAVDDQTRDELDAIEARKQSENDAYEAATRAAADSNEAIKRSLQDRRREEDRIDQDARAAVAKRYEEETKAAEATAAAEIAAIHAAVADADEQFTARQKKADDTYAAEQRAIQDLYNNAETGLIPQARAAAKAVADSFAQQQKDVEASAKAQKDAINDEFTNPQHTGYLDRLEDAKKATDQALKDQLTFWQNYGKDLQEEVKKAFDGVKAEFDRLLKHMTENGGVVVTGASQGDGGDGGDRQRGRGAGPGPGAGGGGVPDPYQVQFPFGARYSNPFSSSIPIHRGVDLTIKGAPNGGKGHAVEAFESGDVVYNAYDPNGGNGVMILTPDGLRHAYFHLDHSNVRVGQHVDAGDVIGTLGETGTEGSPHLHYEVRRHANGDAIGELIDPVPYMTSGREAQQTAPDDNGYFTFTIFGRRFRIRLPGLTVPGDVGRWIREALKEAGLPSEWQDELGMIAAAESGERNADGSVKLGTGNPHAVNARGVGTEHASGLMQTLPSTFEHYRVDSLSNDIFDPVANAAAAARYIKARYGNPHATPYFENGRFDWRGVEGYRNGGWIDRPSLIVDEATLRPYARAGEVGAERVMSPEASRSSQETMRFPIQIGNRTVEELWVQGYRLSYGRGRLNGLPGFGR